MVLVMMIFMIKSYLFAQSSQNVISQGFFANVVGVDATVADIWGYTDSEGREYAIFAVESGVRIVDITVPSHSKEVAFVAGQKSLWHDVKVFKHYAYSVVDVHGSQGLQIIDLSDLPHRVRLVRTVTEGGIGMVHNIFIDPARELLFLLNEREGVHIMSLKDPANPEELVLLKVRTHDAFARGNTLILATGTSKDFLIYDISIPSNPVLTGSFVTGDNAYAHQPYLSTDGKTLFTTEEERGITFKAWNFTRPDSITREASLLGEYLAAKDYIVHQTIIKGDVAFLSHYGMGLRIVDVSDPSNMKEMGYHRPYNISADENGGYNGNWGAYVFQSGTIIHTANPGVGFYIVKGGDAIEKKAKIGKYDPETFWRENNTPFTLKVISYNKNQVKFTPPLEKDYYARIYSMAGQEVIGFTGRGDGQQIKTLNIANGYYILNLKQGEATYMGRVVIGK